MRVLLTTVTPAYQRVSIHGIRRKLLHRQARSLWPANPSQRGRNPGIPVLEVSLPIACPNHIYEERMLAALNKLKGWGIEAVAYGDLFLEDMRAYREELTRSVGLEPLFPLWGMDSATAVEAFFQLGFKATVACCREDILPADFAGRPFDRELLEELPPGVDPGGEKGEFHTFVHDGPIFAGPVGFAKSALVTREGVHYRDFLPIP